MPYARYARCKIKRKIRTCKSADKIISFLAIVYSWGTRNLLPVCLMRSLA